MKAKKLLRNLLKNYWKKWAVIYKKMQLQEKWPFKKWNKYYGI